MRGRWAFSWVIAILIAAAFLIPAVASASSHGVTSGAANAPATSPSPSLLWPCYDPKTYPPSSPPLTPPTAPGTPQVVTYANNYVQLRWTAATDPDGLACYQVYEIRAGVKIKVATFGPGVTTGAFYVDYPPYGTAFRIATLYVMAIDRWGAESPPSGTVDVRINNDVVNPSPTPTPAPVGACRVSYSSYGWFGGMTSSVSISNTGSTPISGWRLTFTFVDAGQRLTNGWQAAWSQTGSTAAATNLTYNRTIAPGGSVTIGFNGSNTGANPTPANFLLNGAICP
jgi:endoglucanase